MLKNASSYRSTIVIASMHRNKPKGGETERKALPRWQSAAASSFCFALAPCSSRKEQDMDHSDDLIRTLSRAWHRHGSLGGEVALWYNAHHRRLHRSFEAAPLYLCLFFAFHGATGLSPTLWHRP